MISIWITMSHSRARVRHLLSSSSSGSVFLCGSALIVFDPTITNTTAQADVLQSLWLGHFVALAKFSPFEDPQSFFSLFNATNTSLGWARTVSRTVQVI
jgi:hypothetical protein